MIIKHSEIALAVVGAILLLRGEGTYDQTLIIEEAADLLDAATRLLDAREKDDAALRDAADELREESRVAGWPNPVTDNDRQTNFGQH